MEKYNIIYCDPAWWYPERNKHTSFGGGAQGQYAVMTEDELQRMSGFINSLAAPDCALFMWVTCPRIDMALRLLNAWGFRYSTVAFMWNKVTKNSKISTERRLEDTQYETNFVDENQFIDIEDATMRVLPGNYTGTNVEMVFLGVKGSMCPHIVEKLVPQIVFAPVGEHSSKPAEVGERIVRMFGDMPRIELFARKHTDGWDANGIELDGTDYLKLVEPPDIEEWAKTQT